MRRGFGDKFHAARSREGAQASCDFRGVLLKKIQSGARNAQRYRKRAFMTAHKPEQHFCGWQITQARRAQHGFAVAVIVFVNGALPHIENSVAAELVRLMYIETQT